MTIYVNDASGSWADILQISGFEVSALLSQGRPVTILRITAVWFIIVVIIIIKLVRKIGCGGARQ